MCIVAKRASSTSGTNGPNLVRPRVDEAKPGGRIAGIAAVLRLRSFLEHDDVLGPGCGAPTSGLERSRATADDDDVAVLDARHELFS